MRDLRKTSPLLTFSKLFVVTSRIPIHYRRVLDYNPLIRTDSQPRIPFITYLFSVFSHIIRGSIHGYCSWLLCTQPLIRESGVGEVTPRLHSCPKFTMFRRYSSFWFTRITTKSFFRMETCTSVLILYSFSTPSQS